MGIWQLPGAIHRALHKGVESVLTVLIYAGLFVAIAHRVGWLDRWIWFILEKEAYKLTNKTHITIGSFTIDWSEILQGKITLHASNVVLHTPRRDEWQWDSPLIARVGKATVECNALTTVFHGVFLKREVPIEAYTVVVSDAQVFVERRDSVINVYLLNPTLRLPPPPFPKKAECGDSGSNTASAREVSNVERKIDHQVASAAQGMESSLNSDSSVNSSEVETKKPIHQSGDPTTDSDQINNHNHQAKKLVNEMLQAVQVLGGAAARGELPGALKQQGLELMERLQDFREQDNLEEGIRVMRQMGKVAVESLQSAPEYILPKPDSSREGDKKEIYIRIGRIVASDLRIFTKDSWINSKNSNPEESMLPGATDSMSGSLTGTTKSSSQVNNSITTSVKTTVVGGETTNANQSGNWNKPIFIERLVLRSSELCPPMSMKDSDDLPAIYQNVDKVVEVVWRRLLAEIAKSNTGKLFSTAIGEVVSVMVSNPQHAFQSVPSSTTTPRASDTIGIQNTSFNATDVVTT